MISTVLASHPSEILRFIYSFLFDLLSACLHDSTKRSESPLAPEMMCSLTRSAAQKAEVSALPLPLSAIISIRIR